MIPEKLDDGFTIDLGGRLCRQMTWARRQLWKETARSDVQEALRQAISPPFVLSGEVTTDAEASKVVSFVTGYSVEDEENDLHHLADSVTLHYSKPSLSLLSCVDCNQFCVDHETGVIQRYPNGQPKLIPKGVPVPCDTHVGCGKGNWRGPKGLSDPRWAATWRHFWKYRNDPPTLLRRDPIFLRNRALLNWIVDYGRHPRFDPFVGGDSE